MKIYTRAGDEGFTGLYAGPRVAKDHPRIEAYGTVDELNATLGMARSADLPPSIDVVLEKLQHELFAVGAVLASPDPERQDTHWVGTDQILAIEQQIDTFDDQLPPLKEFVLPSGSAAAAALHVARAVCRRAERRVITLAAVPGEFVSPHVAIYLNRLGDLLFVLARAANHMRGQGDMLWRKPI